MQGPKEKSVKFLKNVPIAKARKMTPQMRAGAVKRKQSKDNSSKGKPGYAKT